MRFLNKVVRTTSEGIELEADPRHAELVVKDLGLESAKVSMVPGSKEDQKSAPARPDKQEIAGTRARISVEDCIDSVQVARESAGGETWQADVLHGQVIDDNDNDELLDNEDARLYRWVAARLHYIAPDRPDISYAVKESASSMSAPRRGDLRRLKKIGRYLIGHPRLISKFKWQSMPTTVTTFTDSDWAGCARSAKSTSTSGGAVCLGEHVLKTYCRQQKVIALSSAEAELYAMVTASAETLAMAVYARDLGLDLKCELYCDSVAALGIAQRAGIGKVRHLRTQGLGVQEVRVSGRIIYRKLLGTKNPADLMTKHMSAELAKSHLGILNMQLTGGRAESAPTLDAVTPTSKDGTTATATQPTMR